MAAGFQLALDTTAPRLTWGAVTGADPGDTLRVAYTLDESGVESAELQLADRTLAADVGPLTITVAIPLDAAGDGTLVAQLVDDVGNRATARLAITLGGVIPPTPGFVPSTGGGMPRAPEGRLLRSRSAARAMSATVVTARVVESTTARVVATYTLPTSETLRSRSAIRVLALTSVTAVTGSRDAARTATRPDVIVRRDGPTFEDELILLDLI